MEKRNFSRDILLGVAIGDALGVPVEFKSREYLTEKPVKEMLAYGTYNQPAGTWSDDSSLTFCLADSLIEIYDLFDIADKFVRWKNHAIWTPYNEVFDIGITTSIAIDKLEKILKNKNYEELCKLRNETDEKTNGNGSLMRILPLIAYIKDKPIKEQFEIIWNVSALTHYHIRSAIACLIYLKFAEYLIKEECKELAYENMQKDIKQFFKDYPISEKEQNIFSRITDNRIETYEENTINSSGYVLDSLEASFWCIMKYDFFHETILAAVNLGHDTDTTAAITGGLAGLIYSHRDIPTVWLNKIAKKEEIIILADELNRKYF